MRLFVRQRYQDRFTPQPLNPCRTAPEPAVPAAPFDPSPIWALRLDPLTKLLLLGYAEAADATGRVLQPDPHVLAMRTGLRVSSVRSLTVALVEQRRLTILTEDAAEAWGFRVTVDGRGER